MSDFFGALLIGGSVAAGAYLWSQKRAGVAETYEVHPASVSTKKDDWRDRLKDSLTDSAVSWIADKLGGKSAPQTQPEATPQTSGGGSVSDWLLDFINDSPVTDVALTKSNERAILDVIGRAEAPGGYNTVYSGSRVQPPRPLTTMTVAEVQDWQRRSVAAGSASTAAGRYQIIRKTLAALVRRGVVSRGELFDAGAQDRCAVALMNDAGYSRFKSGSLPAKKFAQGLSKIWAGLPAFTYDKRGRKATGQSYYAGDGLNRATVTQSDVMAALGGGNGGWV